MKAIGESAIAEMCREMVRSRSLSAAMDYLEAHQPDVLHYLMMTFDDEREWGQPALDDCAVWQRLVWLLDGLRLAFPWESGAIAARCRTVLCVAGSHGSEGILPVCDGGA